jgi:Flp pilus assembly protein TadB
MAPRRCVVLNDHEREALHEIQRRLLVEDPSFARSFESDAERLHRGSPDLVHGTYTVSLVVILAFAAVLLAAGAPVGALVFAAVAAVISEARRRRTPPAISGTEG